MAEEYVQDSSGGSLGGIVGANASWIAYHRARQQSFALMNGPATRGNTIGGKGMFTARTWLGYTSTAEEFRTWNNPWGAKKKLMLGGLPAKATYLMSRPIMGAQMSVYGEKIAASTAFSGMGAGVRAGVMNTDNLGVWLTESMLKNPAGKIATTGLKGHWNVGMAKFMGVQGVQNAAGTLGKEMGEEFLEVGARQAVKHVGSKLGGSLVLKAGGTTAARMVGYAAGPVGWALAAYDVAQLSYYGATGVAKVGEAIHYKIPKAYFQTSMKNLMRPRFEGIGPASATLPENMNNRMRAVQAIQGSRLNARSALGNEAGMLAGHFG